MAANPQGKVDGGEEGGVEPPKEKHEDGLHNAMATAFEAGIATRREVMGGEFVDAALQRNAGKDGEGLQKHVTATGGERCGTVRAWRSGIGAC